MRLLNAVAAALVVLGAQQAGAAGLCKIKALRDVPAVGGDFVLKKGTVIDEVTQYRVDRFTGDASVCNHGGYCYPTKADADGKHLESFDLINCAIDKTKPYAPANESTIYYGFVVIRAQVDPVELRRDDVDNKLLQMGLCNACAYGAADTYVKSPHSACGELIQSALEGSQEAIGKLQDEYQRYCP